MSNRQQDIIWSNDAQAYWRIHSRNPCWNIVIWTLLNTLRWNFNRNSCILIIKNPFEMLSWKWQPFCLGLNVSITINMMRKILLKLFPVFPLYFPFSFCRSTRMIKWLAGDMKYVHRYKWGSWGNITKDFKKYVIYQNWTNIKFTDDVICWTYVTIPTV